MIGKKLIYQIRGKRNTYSIVHFERLIEAERESEEIYPSGHGNIHGTFQECLGQHSKMITSYFRMKIVRMFW